MIKNQRVKHSNEELKSIALKYQHKSLFQKEHKSKYNTAIKRGILNEICSHMSKKDTKGENNSNFKWTDEAILKLIKECKTPKELREKYPKAYGAAHRRGFLLQIPERLQNKHDIQSISKLCSSFGYALISKKYAPSKKIEVACPKKHQYEVKLGDFIQGYRCSRCANKKTSEGEIELLTWVRSFFPNAEKIKIKTNTENRRESKEFDIFIPEINTAIEYCGVFWHQENKIGRSYHKEKMKLANLNSIRLITLFDYEWIHRNDQIKGFLKSIFQKNEKIIAARKCTVKKIDKKTANRFLEENHIQGKNRIQISFGLFYEDVVVGVVTGGPHHRNYGSDLVLNRLCFKNGTTVMGGASKLFSVFKQEAEKLKYKNIISWSDNRFSEGSIYKKLNFSLETDLPIDYFYAKNDRNIKKKQSCKKQNLMKMGGIGNTEKEMAESLGYFRVWDCGKKRWVYNL